MREGWISVYAKRIDEELVKSFTGNSKLHEMANEVLLSGGKRIRGVLAVLGCEAVGGDSALGIKTAAIYELAHAASVLEDDLIDENSKRWGKKSFHVRYGKNRTILVSNLLIFKVFEMLSDLVDKVDNATIKRILSEEAKASSMTVLGQFKDLEMKDSNTVTEKEYLEMIKNKTGTLIALPLVSGAIIGGGSDNKIEKLRTIGEKIGMVYQIKDDILDIFGNSNKIKKEVFIDVRSGLKNLAIIHAIKNSNELSKKKIMSILGNQNISNKEIEEFKSIIIETGSKRYAEEKAKNLFDEVLSELKNLRLPNQKKLEEIAKIAIEQYR